MTLAEGPDAGTELSALGIGSFAEKTLVAAGQCTKVDPQARPAAVGLVGCGAMAGLGAAINTGAVTRGKSVAVIGCGGVGRGRDRRVGAGRCLADHRCRHRREEAGVGEEDGRDAHRRLVGARPGGGQRGDLRADPRGCEGGDVVVDAVGRPHTWKQAFYARDLAGTVVLVGVPTPEMKLPDLPLVDVFSRGGP